MSKPIALAFCLFTTVAAFASEPAAGLSADQHPSKYCDLAKEQGYSGGPFGKNSGACSSATKSVTPTPGTSGLYNGLTFYSMGFMSEPGELHRVSLILNVNNEREAAKARAELARVAAAVATKLLGNVPKELQATILSGKTKTWSGSVWDVDVITTRWPTKLGHDITVRYTPADK